MNSKLTAKTPSRSVQLSRGLLFGCFSVVFVFVAAALPALSSSPLTPGQLFSYATWVGIFYFVCVSALDLFFISRSRTVFGVANPKLFLKFVVFSLVSGLIFEGLTLVGAVGSSVFDLSDWGLKRAGLFAALSFSALVVIARSLRTNPLQTHGGICASLESVTWKKYLLPVISLLGLSCLFALFLNLGVGTAFPPALFFCCSVVFSLAMLASAERLRAHPEWAFLVIALTFSSFMATQVPAMTGVSWDDQIHYRNALSLSYLTAPEKCDEELEMENMAVLRAQGKKVGIDIEEWDSKEIDRYYEELSDDYAADIEEGRVSLQYDFGQLLSFSSIGYVPSAIGLWLGRLLHLSYPVIVVLGRLSNAIFYSLVCFFAIRITPTKKTIFSVVALLPTNLFLAASYSYDPWLVSCLLLAVALLFREMWGNQEALSLHRLVPPIFIMFVGLCVKAVYFPIIGLFFLMPRSKFTSERQRRQYYFLTIVFGLFVFASFALPYLFTVESDSGDARGGTGVDPFGQIVYILANPLEYVKTLVTFFSDHYFNPTDSSGYTFFFAYLSNTEASAMARNALNLIDVLFLVFVAVFDGMDDISRKYASLPSSIWSLFLFVCSFVLVATALYVSFTPVGLDTVNGCQQRYILPWLAPGLALVLNVGIPFNGQVLLRRFALSASILMLSICVFFDILAKLVV